MKKLLCCLLLAVCFVSCNSRAQVPDGKRANNGQILSHEDSVYLKAADPEILKTMSQAEIVRMVAAYKLFEHVELKDSIYTLLLSESEAEKIGVPADLYREMLKSIEEVNKAVAEAHRRHEEVDMIDLKDYVLKGMEKISVE